MGLLLMFKDATSFLVAKSQWSQSVSPGNSSLPLDLGETVNLNYLGGAGGIGAWNPEASLQLPIYDAEARQDRYRQKAAGDLCDLSAREDSEDDN
jgi:hypothetical protein